MAHVVQESRRESFDGVLWGQSVFGWKRSVQVDDAREQARHHVRGADGVGEASVIGTRIGE